MKIYNSLSKQKEEFTPLVADEVKMYVCGVTPYDYAHIGNARPAIVFDTLYRFLTAQGKKVTYVRNFTDVDDKIINRAGELGLENWQDLPQKYIEVYHQDMAQLNVLGSVDDENILEPKVTDHIAEIISMIKTLLDKGIAYIGESGDVLYDTSKFPEYGKLSGNVLESLNAGQRVAVSEDKKNETDFVLWKSTKENEPMSWPFDYTDAQGQKVNAGRPGWHIECSAMALKHLGESFDIHGGGEDLKFPHHECEIAQSKGACGHDAKHANYWMHNAFINVDGEKMSKSLGNFKTIHSLLEKYSGEAIRLWMLSTHYRKPVDLTEDRLDDSMKTLTDWYNMLSKKNLRLVENGSVNDLNLHLGEIKKGFDNALQDDLNTPLAISFVHKAIKELATGSYDGDGTALNLLSYMGQSLGILQQNSEEFLRGGVDGEAIDVLVKQRDEAKASKNWALADQIRDDLKAQGIILEDGASGTTWRKA